MAKELFIVFLYDTEVRLREEDDPQTAVVFFHPSWVSANQRMALCGQLIGVTQFLVSGFVFPHTIALNNGKFAMKRIGRFILCVGTDRNIPGWILEKRCEILFHTLQFFHADLHMFCDSAQQKAVAEKLVNVMEVYLPVLLYAGNIFGNGLTIRLPKSAGSIFLEAAQLLECLQSKESVHGGAVCYQNKVVMSQLNPDITKQIIVTDPYRIKIPAENVATSFQLPAGVQLIVVYVDEAELNFLQDQKVPSSLKFENIKNKKVIEDTSENPGKWTLDAKPPDRSRIFTVLEEESEVDHAPPKSKDYLARMPDVVKDTVRTIKKDETKKHFSEIRVESYIVDSLKKSKVPSSCSSENLQSPQNESVRYCSFGSPRRSEEEDKFPASSADPSKVQHHCRLNYYNTISDPVNPWFRNNGLPASKALRDDRITFYCRDINNGLPPTKLEDQSKEAENTEMTECCLKRPTSIEFGSKDAPKKKSRIQKSVGLLLELKKEFSEAAPQCPPPSGDVPLTPLMSKLSLLDLSQRSVPPAVLTPATSVRCLQDDGFVVKQDTCDKSNRQAKRKPHRQKSVPTNQKKLTRRSALFVFGHQNISLYLLLKAENANNYELINCLWKTCMTGAKDMEANLQQCMESIPQTQAMGVANESYSYLNIHAMWETLNHGGQWTGPQLDLLNIVHNDFDSDGTLTDITVRLEDSILYGRQMADNQLFYQQSVPPIAGLPTPSDLMGTVSLKAKRRLERDHGLLIV